MMRRKTKQVSFMVIITTLHYLKLNSNMAPNSVCCSERQEHFKNGRLSEHSVVTYSLFLFLPPLLFTSHCSPPFILRFYSFLISFSSISLLFSLLYIFFLSFFLPSPPPFTSVLGSLVAEGFSQWLLKGFSPLI